MKSTLFLFLTLIAGQLLAQTEGDYRSVSPGGDWSATGTWQRFTSGVWSAAPAAPSSADGVVTITSGAPVIITGAVTIDQVVIPSGGNLTISAATTVADGTGTDIDIASGGALNIGAAMTVSGNIDNAGNIAWTAGNLSFTSGVLNNNNIISITGNNSMTNTSGTNALNNASGASISKNAGTGNSNIQIPVNNAGTINVNSGAIRTNSGTAVVVNTGTINVTNGSTFSGVLGNLTLNAGSAITGTGLVRIPATAINIPLTTPSGIELELNGDITGTGPLVVNGKLTWTSGAM